MKTHLTTVLTLFIIGSLLTSCAPKISDTEMKDNIASNKMGKGDNLTIQFSKGKEHNHPTFALWVEDASGNFIQTLFVTQYLATGEYLYKQVDDGKWSREPGDNYRPSALPYWLHKKGPIDSNGTLVPNKNNPIPDAYTGATPQGNFELKTKTDKPLPKKFRVLLEINQPWDWNDHWTNNKYPDEKHYSSSCQPSLVYMVEVDQTSDTHEYYLNPIGHGHFSGANGKLYTDLSSFTTAFDIAKQIKVIVK